MDRKAISMNLVPYDRLLSSLEKIRDGLCCYSLGAQWCDCKYLADASPFVKVTYGEQTGCCEVRAAIHILTAYKREIARDIYQVKEPERCVYQCCDACHCIPGAGHDMCVCQI